MAHPYKTLQTLSRDALIAEYDRLSSSTVLGLGFYRDEIFRRDFEEQNRQLLGMTAHIRWLTALVAVLTFAVTVATVVGLAR